jgi:ureidoacrylate peracid hydrolase
MVEFAVVPERLALVNIDVQRCFVSESPLACPGARALVPRINQFAAVCRSSGVAVVHVRHVLEPDGSNAGVLGEISPIVKGGVIAAGSRTAELDPSLVVADSDLVVDKPRFGAFQGTDLEPRLRERGIDSIVVAGLVTNVCCDTTAREAFARDFRVFFLSDGTATSGTDELTADEVQRATCSTLARRFAEVLTIEQMTARIRAAVATRNDSAA